VGRRGKGKIVDVLSHNFSVVARYAGGHNAGHTVISKAKSLFCNWCPCGVLRKVPLGHRHSVVLDPWPPEGVKMLPDAGVQVDGNLFVSNRAHVDLCPYHRMIEMERRTLRTRQDRHHVARYWPGL